MAGHRLSIPLPPGSADDLAAGSPGRRTVYRTRSSNPGPLQVSLAVHRGGSEPRPSEERLREMAVGFGKHQRWGELQSSSTGECGFGRYGSAVFHSWRDRIQVWMLSNGRDFIMATHVAGKDVEPAEVEEAEAIVRAIGVEGD
jgi:hypothetical protein